MGSLTYALITQLLLNSFCADDHIQLKKLNLDTIPKVILVPYINRPALPRGALFLQYLAEDMRLPVIEEKKEGLFIRIWFRCFDKSYVVNISKEGVTREVAVVEWKSQVVDRISYIAIQNKWDNLKPRDGWDSFFSTLDKFKIRTLKSGRGLMEHSENLAHSSYVQFEVEENGKYRYYEYLEPAFYRYVENDSRNVFRLLEYINQQINIKIYNPDSLYARPK
jgi:hypothetical protein